MLVGPGDCVAGTDVGVLGERKEGGVVVGLGRSIGVDVRVAAVEVGSGSGAVSGGSEQDITKTIDAMAAARAIP